MRYTIDRVQITKNQQHDTDDTDTRIVFLLLTTNSQFPIPNSQLATFTQQNYDRTR
ncbi:MAG: hypothetical protein ACRC62_11265 [Microcoleus sp.]